MPKLNLIQRNSLIRLYYCNQSNAAAALREYRRQLGLRRGPCSSRAVQNLIKKFEDGNPVSDLPRSGRPGVSEDIVDEVVVAAVAKSEIHAHRESLRVKYRKRQASLIRLFGKL